MNSVLRSAVVCFSVLLLLSLAASSDIDSSQVPAFTDLLNAIGGSYTRAQVANISCDDFAGGRHEVALNCTDDGFITSITVLRETGFLPDSISQLDTVTQLTLGQSSLANFPLIASIAKLSSLERMNMFAIDSPFGTFPAAFKALTALSYLQMNGVSLEGTLPLSLSGLSNLVHLDLSFNSLTGTVPEFLSSLQSLTTLMLGGNVLKGSIPRSLGDLPALQQLVLSSNFLVGNIPASFSKLQSLTFLDASFNSLSGTLPRLIGAPVQWLYLTSNYFTGAANVVGCKILGSTFDLSSNCLAKSSSCLDATNNNQRTPQECQKFCRAGVWANPGPACAGLGLCVPSIFSGLGGSHFYCSKCAFPTTSMVDSSTCSLYRACTQAPQWPCPGSSEFTSPCPNGHARSCCCCPGHLPYPVSKFNAKGKRSMATCTKDNPI